MADLNINFDISSKNVDLSKLGTDTSSNLTLDFSAAKNVKPDNYLNEFGGSSKSEMETLDLNIDLDTQFFNVNDKETFSFETKGFTNDTTFNVESKTTDLNINNDQKTNKFNIDFSLNKENSSKGNGALNSYEMNFQNSGNSKQTQNNNQIDTQNKVDINIDKMNNGTKTSTNTQFSQTSSQTSSQPTQQTQMNSFSNMDNASVKDDVLSDKNITNQSMEKPKDVITLQSKDNNGNIITEEISLDEFRNDLKQCGFTDTEINDILSGKTTPKDVFEKIENDPKRLKGLMATSYLEALGLEYKTLDELNKAITEDKKQLQELLNKRTEADNRELDNFFLIISRVQMGESLDNVISSQIVAWRYTDESGNTCYKYTDPYSELYISGESPEYTALTYEEMYPDSKYVEEFRSVLQQYSRKRWFKDEIITTYTWGSTEEEYTFLENFTKEYNDALTNRAKNLQALDKQIEETRSELEKYSYYYEYINNEIDYYLKNVNAYTKLKDFESYSYYDSKIESTLDEITDRFKGINYGHQAPIIPISDIDEIVAVLSAIANGNESMTGNFIVDKKTGFRVMLTSTDDYNIIDHFGTWVEAGALKEEEIKVFNYILNKEGSQKAYEYILDISHELDNRWLAHKTEEDQEYAKEHPFLASVASIVITPFEGISAACYSTASYFKNVDIYRADVYSAGDVYRKSVSEEIDNDALRFVYDTGMSMADTTVLIGIGALTGGVGMPAISAVTMGSRAYVSCLNDCLDRGLSDGQAVALAWTSAGVETLMESYSAGHLLNLEGALSSSTTALIEKTAAKIANPQLAKIATNTMYIFAGSISQGLAEGEEEFSTEVLNYICDELIAGDLSNHTLAINSYMEQGYTEEEARRLANKDFEFQLGQAFLGGFASGVCFGTVGSLKTNHTVSRGIAKTIETEYKGDKANFLLEKNMTEAQVYAEAYETLRLNQEAQKQLAKELRKNNLIELEEKVKNVYSNIVSNETFNINKALLGTLTSPITTFKKLSLETVKENPQLLRKIENEGLYHITTEENALKILDSNTVLGSKPGLVSYGGSKSFFFAGIPNLGEACLNLNIYQEKLVAVKINESAQNIIKENFKYRVDDDFAITHKGDYNFKKGDASLVYLGLKINEQGEFVYEEISKEEYQNYSLNKENVNVSKLKEKTLSAIKGIFYGLSYQYDVLTKRVDKLNELGLKETNNQVENNNITSSFNEIQSDTYQLTERFSGTVPEQLLEIIQGYDEIGTISKQTGLKLEELFFDEDYVVGIHRCGITNASTIIDSGLNLTGHLSSGVQSDSIDLSENISFHTSKTPFEFALMLAEMKTAGNYKTINQEGDCLLIRIPKSEVTIDGYDVKLNENSSIIKNNGTNYVLDESCIAGYVNSNHNNLGEFIENNQSETTIKFNQATENKLNTKEDLDNLIRSVRNNTSQETIDKISNEFIDTLSKKQISLDQLKLIGNGESSFIFEYDGQIIKLSTMSYDNYSTLTDYVKESTHILKPIDEVTVNLGNYNASILFQEKLDLSNITEQDVTDMALALREDGYLWYDLKKENIGKDMNGNLFLIDYGELININNMSDYKKESELKTYQKMYPLLDEAYKKNLVNNAKTPLEILENINNDSSYDYLFIDLLEKGYTSNRLYAIDFIKQLEENQAIIKNLTTDQLITLYAIKNNGNNNQISTFNLIEEEIMTRLRNGENILGGNNYNFYKDFKGQITNTYSLTGFSKEHLQEITEIQNKMWQDFKLEYPDIASFLAGSISYKTFLNFGENMDIMTKEKLEVFKKLTQENINIGTTSINFKIFEDEIFNMGEDFLSLIAKYPNIEAKVINISKNETKLNVLKEIVNKYSNSSDYIYKSVLDSTINYLNNHSTIEISSLDIETIINNALSENIKTNGLKEENETFIEALYRHDSNLKITSDEISNKINTFDENNYTSRIEMFNNEQIKVIEVTSPFNMLVYSTDSGIIKFSKMNENIVQDWFNQPNTQHNYISTSYISDSNFKTADVGENGYIMGFTNVNSEDIRLVCDMDAHTRLSEFNLNSLNGNDSYTLNDLDQARRGYTDIAIKRVKPDYIVLFKDSSEIQKNNAYEAASKWNIPVIEIDTNTLIDNHIELENNLMNQGNISQVITDFENLANSLGLNVIGNQLEIEQMEQQKNKITDYLISYAKESETNLTEVKDAITREIERYAKANNDISNAVKTQSYLAFDINVLEEILTSLNNVEIIDIKTLNMSRPGAFQLSKERNTNLIYEGYDLLYRTDANHLEEIISQVNNQEGKILIELKNTTNLTTELINKLPDNISIRIVGAYTNEFLQQGFKTLDGAIGSGKNTIYTKEQLLKIITELENFESGINPEWNDYEKALYAYEYLRDNIEYTDDDIRIKGKITSQYRKQQFESLTNLIEKESTYQGFAFTYQELLNRMGINCVEIGGTNGVQHAWNIVTIGEDIFIVDTTYESFDSKENGTTGFGLINYSKYVPKNNKELFNNVNQNSDTLISNISDYNLSSKIIKQYSYENFLSLFDPNEPFRDYIFEDISKMDISDLKKMSDLIYESLENGKIDYSKLTFKDKIRLKYLINDIFIEEGDGDYLFIPSEDYSSYKIMARKEINDIISIFYYHPNEVNEYLKKYSNLTLDDYKEIIRNVLENEKYHDQNSITGYHYLRESVYQLYKFAYNIESNQAIEQINQLNPKYLYNIIIQEEQNGLQSLTEYTASANKTVKGTTSFFEKFGSYGVKQSSTNFTGINDLKKYDSLSKIADSYFPGMSVIEKVKLFNLVDSVGACTYATTCNVIYTYYKDKPLVFRKDFGYDMYITEHGVTKLNDSALLLDLYCFANKNNLIKNDSGVWKSEKKATNQVYMNNNHSMLNNFLKSKNPNLSAVSPNENSYIQINSSNYNADMLRYMIKDYIESGYQIGLSLYNNVSNESKRNELIFKIQDITNKEILNSFLERSYFTYYSDNKNSVSTSNWGRTGHSTMITGIDESGDIIVCSWGRKFKVKVDEIINNGKIYLDIMGIKENGK